MWAGDELAVSTVGYYRDGSRDLTVYWEPRVLEWLKLSDLALAQKIDYEEKYGPEENAAFKAFADMRGHLSHIAWNSFASALRCDQGPIARTGLIWRLLDESMAARLDGILQASPEAKLRRDDFAMGYLSNSTTGLIEYFNSSNEYRAITPDLTAALTELLSIIGPEIERNLGHPFRICSTHQFQLRPSEKTAYRHLDQWPVSIRKIFILPKGAGRKLGSTWFRMRDGKEVVLESDKPLWAIFENSIVWHAPVASEALRPTIELDLVPASVTDFEPFYAGVNGLYPWFPTEEGLLEGTRTALQLATATQAKPKSLIGRLLNRGA
jgi:hypothetical protein